MIGTIITAIISFISTNIDNIFVVMLLYSRVDGKLRKRDVVIGQYVGLAILIAISLFGATGFTFLPQKYIGLLGITPIALGVKEWITYRKSKQAKPDTSEDTTTAKTETKTVGRPLTQNDKPSRIKQILSAIRSSIAKVIKPELLSVIFVAVANGADNIGVYIPLFSGYNSIQFAVTFFVFTFMMALWCFLGDKITGFPKIKSMIQKYKALAVPIVFVGLGVYIILKGFL